MADPASDKQIAFITRLAEEHDTSKIGTFPRRTLDAITGGSAHTVSKGRASRLIEVLTRQPKIQTQDEVRGPAASEAQMSFLRTLCEEQGQEVPENPTKAEASARISELLENRKGGQVRTPAKTSGVTEDGMYQTADGSVYKVQIVSYYNEAGDARSSRGPAVSTRRSSPSTSARTAPASGLSSTPLARSTA